MVDVISNTGGSSIVVENGFSMSIPEPVAIEMWEDLGSISTDGSHSLSSGLREIEYEELEYSPTVIETHSINLCNFKQISLELSKQYTFDYNKILVLGPDPFKNILSMNIQNKSPEVLPVTESSFGTFIITVPRGRFISIDMNIFGNCSMSNLPAGLALENNILSGITWASGTYRGEIVSNNSKTPYSIIIPQIERIF